MEHNGLTIWLTGLPGSGKTTLARSLSEELSRRGYRVEVLDGDVVRQTLNPTLGFSKRDRDLHVARLGRMAHERSSAGVVTIVAAISPYREARHAVRRLHSAAFVEIYIKCALEELVRRDPKGLYSQALQGRIAHFTGISDPYEAPASPEITVRTDRESPAQSHARIVTALESSGLIERI